MWRVKWKKPLCQNAADSAVVGKEKAMRLVCAIGVIAVIGGPATNSQRSSKSNSMRLISNYSNIDQSDLPSKWVGFFHLSWQVLSHKSNKLDIAFGAWLVYFTMTVTKPLLLGLFDLSAVMRFAQIDNGPGGHCLFVDIFWQHCLCDDVIICEEDLHSA